METLNPGWEVTTKGIKAKNYTGRFKVDLKTFKETRFGVLQKVCRVFYSSTIM